MMSPDLLMCPHCGWRYERLASVYLVLGHPYQGEECPGSSQIPRNPESDRRRLWKDLADEKRTHE